MNRFNEFWNDVGYYRLETNHPYTVYEDAFKEGHVNGCGAKGGINFPDTFWGVSVESACDGHDVDWLQAKSLEELLAGNYRWRRNMEKIIDRESGNRFTLWLRLKRMSKYYRMVKLVGTPAEAKNRGYT